MANILLVVANKAALTAQETAQRNRLTGTHGHTIAATVSDEDADPGEAGYDGVYICEAVSSTTLSTKYSAVAKPVINCESGCWTSHGYASDQSQVTGITAWNMQASAGALAAGLSGSTTVYTSGQTQSRSLISSLGAGALVVAQQGTDTTRACVYVYDTGATRQAGGAAPARRVALGVVDLAFGAFNANGLAVWDALVQWAFLTTQTVTLTGIPTAEAHGASTITAGPVTVTPGGIPSAEAHGTAQLNLTVALAGIPTAEAFGTVAVTVGGLINLTGIPTAEAFGAPTVTAGPVTVTLTGIPTAEAVGTLSLALTVAPTGIASAEAHGTPALVVGAATVALTGIPSAEAFGTAVLVAGPVTVTATGIPSAETFGAAAVSLTLYATGIPTGEAFGTPALTVGAVAIVLTGIASAETFGGLALNTTIDIATRPGRRRRRLTPLYELLAVGRVPQPAGPPMLLSGEPIEWTKLTWSSTLSRPQTLSVTCPIASITESVAQRLRTPERLPTELHLQRNGSTVFAGPLMGGGRQGSDLTLEASGLLAYLQWMFVLDDLRFDQVDQFGIVAALIDQWQDTEFGHFGIDTSDVGVSGVLRDATYERAEIHQVSRRVEELGERRDGFDAEVDPTTRKLQLWYPGKGADRSSGEDAVVFDERNIDDQSAMFSIAPGDLASDAFGASSSAGSDTRLWSAQSDADLRAAFGRAGAAGSWSDVSEQATLDAHTAGLLDARGQAFRAPGRRVRVTPDSDLGSYAEGDTVSYEVDKFLGIGGPFRIRSRRVTVEPTGAEAVDLEFV